MINLKPDTCNLCEGKVIFTSNSKIYGKEYGSGKMYFCTNCGAYVGTHVPRPKEALGILANQEMRELKKKCHHLFDQLWINEEPGQHRRKARSKAYRWLSKKMRISVEVCHFGYFDMVQLNKAYQILQKKWESEENI